MPPTYEAEHEEQLEMVTLKSLRKIWESDREWVSRKQFLKRHWSSSMDPYELDSLSSVWINNLVLGCKYPQETLVQVKEMSEGLEVTNLLYLHGVPKEFVKASLEDDEDVCEVVGGEEEESNLPVKPLKFDPQSVVGKNPFKKKRMLPTTEEPANQDAN